VALAQTARVMDPDLQEPLSPELVLVCPELREFALTRDSQVPPPPRRPGGLATPPIPIRSASTSPHTSRQSARPFLPSGTPRPTTVFSPNVPRPVPRQRTTVRKLSRSVATIAALAVVALAVLPHSPFRLPIDSPKERGSSVTSASVGQPTNTVTGATSPTKRTHRTPDPAGKRATVPARVRHARSPRPAGSTAPSPGASAGASPTAPTHSETEAERHVLASPGFFHRLAGGGELVDRATRLFRPNASVRCSTRSPKRHRAHTFDCTVRRGRVAFHVRYIATGPTSFRLLP
jgi:hypothetical protein